VPGQWYAMTRPEILEYFKTDLKNGLSEKEARERSSRFGPNQLVRTPKILLHQLFFKQFKSIILLALLAATVISVICCEHTDAVTLTVIVITSAILGGIQEYRAIRSINKLKLLTALTARVIRDGRERKVPAVELVPGDIVLLSEGDLVPADLRLLQTVKLKVDESALTGKSVPVSKMEEALPGNEVALEDTLNMAYMNTVVTRGRGCGLVVHTGMATEIGYITGMIRAGGHDKILSQHRLTLFSKSLAAFCLLTCALVLTTRMLKGEDAGEICLAGLSLAVAAIPVGLPTLVTVIMAVGAHRMLRRGAIIRKLPALDTLGCATVICLNKTGTFTKNEMTVRKVVAGGSTFEVTGDGFDPKGEFTGTGDKHDLQFTLLTKAAALCNNAVLKRGSINIAGFFRGLTGGRSGREWSVTGDSTEGALLVMAAKAGFWRERLEIEEQRVAELPFEPERKRMTVVYREPSGTMAAYVKGAPDMILELCTHSFKNGKIVPLSDRDREEILAHNALMAKEALRVLAFAYRELPADTKIFSEEFLEQRLIFLGLTGMFAPLKPAAVKAVQICRRAGIKIVLFTGDHQFTAQATAKKLGIISTEEKVLTGYDLDRMSGEQLREHAGQVSVFARVTPKQKLLIIRVLKQLGHVVAVTGDGVEDVPAVKEADIGIAMGVTGAGVIKEASTMLLAEDHFGSIAAAVEEGRGIYNNIRRSIRFLLSCNTGEILITFLAVSAGLPLPLIPVQILWVNVICNGLPVMALGMEPYEHDLMTRSPRHLGDNVLDRSLTWRIITGGTVIGLSTLISFMAGLSLGDTPLARTMAFNTLVFSQLFFVLTCRNEYHTSLQEGIFTNLYLVGAVSISCVLQIAMNCVPFMQSSFHVVHLNNLQWAYVLSISVIPAVFGILFRRIAARVEKKIMYLKVRLG